jgi:hypothetical protein
LNLSKYDELGNCTKEIIFDNVYNFTDKYNLQEINFQSFDTLMERFKKDLETIKKAFSMRIKEVQMEMEGILLIEQIWGRGWPSIAGVQ